MKYSLIIGVFIFVFFGCTTQAQKITIQKVNKMKSESVNFATFGGGCFWCTEAIFDQLEGVQQVESGYSGGHVNNPSYKEVCNGTTGHAEVIHITYNPMIIAYEDLLDIFFNTHDPTTLNRQGADRGTQYRSVVYYHDSSQMESVNSMISALDTSKVFKAKIVTEVTVFEKFYVAEDYHQNYFINNRNQGYCQIVINPKLEKFQKEYKDKLKKN